MRRGITRRQFVGKVALTAGATQLIPLLAACSPAAPAAPTASAVATGAASPAAGAPIAGGILKVALGAEPTTLDPHKKNTLNDFNVRTPIFEGLTVDNAGVGGVKPALAESWESTDGKSWTFKLRQGVKFHDGSAFTADDVKATIDRVKNDTSAASGQTKPTVNRITNLTVVDKYTIRIDVQNPEATFPVAIADIKIVRPNFDAAKPVGTGPFEFVEWVRNTHVRVRKFADYHTKPLPHLDEIMFLPTPDQNQAINRLRTGEVDLIDVLPLARAAEMRQRSEIQVLEVEAGTSPSAYGIIVKTTVPPLNDVRVRQAISHALDRAATIDVNFGFGVVRTNMIPPKHWAYNPQANRYNKRDVAKAKQLLAEAGYANGFPIRMKYFTLAGYAEIAQLVQANLAEVGIKVELLAMEIGVWIEQVLNQQDFELGFTGHTPGYDPDEVMTRVYDINFSNGRASGWRNKEFLDLLVRGRATVDQAERTKIYQRAQVILDEESPHFLVADRPVFYGAAAAVQGFFAHPLGRLVNLHEVWLKK